MSLDIIFLSYNETNADENWQALKARFPFAKRVHGIKGLACAHKAAAEASDTEFFFVVDGDNRILPEFEFSTQNLILKPDTIYVWRCQNPVNGLTYGYGAVKLYNKRLLQKRYEGRFVDLASSVTEKYCIVDKVASETHFYCTPEEAWRGGFRECAKLASQKIHRQKNDETLERLNIWCERAPRYVPNSQWALLGARQGRDFGKTVLIGKGDLKSINDFHWLHTRFIEVFRENHRFISVVIPTHNRHKDLLRLLKSLKAQSLETSFFEVLVISNFQDSELEHKIFVQQYPFHVQIESVGKLGVNSARNLGLERARGEIVFFLDDDCELIDNDHLKKLRSQHLYYENALAIGGGYEVPEGTNYISRVYHYLASFWFDAQSRQSSQALNLLGGNVSYKLSKLKQYHLKFDDSIVFGGAESEFHTRLIAKGFELRNTSPSVRHHLKMGLKSFYRKAFMQGMGAEKIAGDRGKKKADHGSPRGTLKYIFMRYHYDRVFNKGRIFARKNPAPFENLPYQNEGWRLFFQNSVLAAFFLPYGLVMKGFWFLYQMIYVNVVVQTFWLGYKSCLISWGFLKRMGIFTYWRGVKLRELVKSHMSKIYWRGYHHSLKVRGHIKRQCIFIYWKIYPVSSYLKGQWKKYSIKTYWFLYYMKKQFYKDMQKKLQLWYFGVDTNNLPRSFKLADSPSMYLPVSGQCTSSCSYCPQLKARWNLKGSIPKPEISQLSAMGYNSVTYPCNFLSLELSEQEEWSRQYQSLGQEIVINPDFVDPGKKASVQKIMNSLENLGDIKVLLLFRHGRVFHLLRQALKSSRISYRILFVFDVSGDPKKLYQSLPIDDWGRIQFLNSSSQSPEVTDDRNRKLAPKVGRAIKQFQWKDQSFWPQTSHVHYPFLVSEDSKAAVWVYGTISWQSSAVETMFEIPKYSIVVPVRYQIDHACKVLTNLAHQQYDSHDFEILFVDDGNDEELAVSIEQAWKDIGEPPLNIRVVRYPRDTEMGYDTNYRAGQARNMGLRFAKGERLLFVDSDILIAPDLFQRLDKSLTDNMIIQFPRYMLTEDATRSFSNYESIKMNQHTYPQSEYWEEFKKTDRWMNLKNYWKYTCTYGLCLTRKTLSTTGPFRADFIFYGFEDVDLGYRLFQRGGEFLLLKSPVYHLYPDQNHSFHFDKEKRYQALSRSASIFFQRNMDLNFYFDLKGFLNRPWHIRLRKPYYTFRYHARKKLPMIFGSPEA